MLRGFWGRVCIDGEDGETREVGRKGTEEDGCTGMGRVEWKG